MTNYDEVRAWLREQQPEILEQIIKDLHSDWHIDGGDGYVIRLTWSQTDFSNKIGLIKDYRALSGLGLKEAKDFVEAAQGRADGERTGITGRQSDLQSKINQLSTRCFWSVTK